MIKSVVRAINILEAIHKSGQVALGMTEIARKVDLDKSTTFNLIKTLKDKGFVEQDSKGGQYRLGKKLMELTKGTLYEDYLRQKLGFFCKELVDKGSESLSMVTNADGECKVICRILCKNAVIAKPLENRTLYRTASGRCLLAQFTDEDVKQVLKIHGYPGNDWDNINDWSKLSTALGDIRKTGVTTLISKIREVAGIGSIIKTPSHMPLLAIGYFLPLYRLNALKQKNLTYLIEMYAQKISEQLKISEVI